MSPPWVTQYTKVATLRTAYKCAIAELPSANACTASIHRDTRSFHKLLRYQGICNPSTHDSSSRDIHLPRNTTSDTTERTNAGSAPDSKGPSAKFPSAPFNKSWGILAGTSIVWTSQMNMKQYDGVVFTGARMIENTLCDGRRAAPRQQSRLHPV